MDALIEEIKKKLSSNVVFEEETPKFSDASYKPFKISKNNFHKIEKAGSSKKLAFIDGGNSEILKAADFSLNLIRVYCSIYKANKKIKSKKYEFYSLVYAEGKDEIFYKAKLFSENKEILPDEKDLSFSSFDESLKTGIHRINISMIANVIRRFSELRMAKNIIEELDNEDILVLDGSLQSSTTNEDGYLNELFEKALEKNILVSALSKTCSIMTEKGNSLISVLGALKAQGRWNYSPVAEINSLKHQAEMFFVKLHEKSRHIFRFEVYKKQKHRIDETLSLIAENSNDPVFLGYPYGLIEADRFARVSNKEMDYFKTKLVLRLGSMADRLNEHLNVRNAHEILDKLS
ncbi:DNA double-strand break repair nuclease NurA [Candidatus Woesearchaeota archaeon]|nr:DNA double-strand break repair nuclease NurA [Candidatus Woesearchaeota archaeon]